MLAKNWIVGESGEIVVVSFVDWEATRPLGPSEGNVWDHANGYLVSGLTYFREKHLTYF